MEDVKISPGAYDEPTQQCPYCNADMEADWVDVGVGSVQCGPYHCWGCGASEIGPEIRDWLYKDREGEVIYLAGRRRYHPALKKKVKFLGASVMRADAPFDKEELKTGFYKGSVSPYANTINGVVVDHQTAETAYKFGALDEKDV